MDIITFGPDLVLKEHKTQVCVFEDRNCKNISLKVVRIQTSTKKGLERKYLSFSPPHNQISLKNLQVELLEVFTNYYSLKQQAKDQQIVLWKIDMIIREGLKKGPFS